MLQRVNRHHIIYATLFGVSSLLFLSFSLLFDITISYDEVGYAYNAQYIAQHNGLVNIYAQNDVFFFPPLFNYLAALLIKLGINNVWAVRLLSILFSSLAALIIYKLGEIYFDRKSAVILYLLYIFSPEVIHFSAIGQVETAFFAMILLSFYFITLFHRDGKISAIILASISLALSTWIKEAAIGFIPALLLIIPSFESKHTSLIQKLKPAIIFLITSLILISPLFFHLFSMGRTSIIHELVDSYLSWDNFSLDIALRHLMAFWSLGLFFTTRFSLCAACIFFPIMTLSLSKINRRTLITNKIFLFATVSIAIWLPFFIIYPRKFEYYFYPIFVFTTIFAVKLFVKLSKTVLLLLLAAYLVSASVSLVHLTLLTPYKDLQTLIEKSVSISPHKVAFIFPHEAYYIVKEENINVEIISLDFIKCHDKLLECMKENNVETLIARAGYLRLLYSTKISAMKSYCNEKKLRDTLVKFDVVQKRGGYQLYKLR